MFEAGATVRVVDTRDERETYTGKVEVVRGSRMCVRWANRTTGYFRWFMSDGRELRVRGDQADGYTPRHRLEPIPSDSD